LDVESLEKSDCETALYVVATPIGNLDDITVRAIETLRRVDVIACEDTRTSRVLLNSRNISTPLISLHRFNENRKTKTILEHLQNGQRVALISDAGTPNISDPGYRLVRSVMEAGFRVVPIPGPSSIITALSVAGIDGSSFVFMGFSPKKELALRSFFQKIDAAERTAVFLEPARRIMKVMDVARQLLPGRKLVLCRELTKKFEEIISGEVESVYEQLAKRDNIKGEFVVLIEYSKKVPAIDIEQLVLDLMQEGYSGKSLASEAQSRYQVSKTAAYAKFLTIIKSKSEGNS
jgi:16S rRNA (cytidine1402-2'-O)-methyltransferase